MQNSRVNDVCRWHRRKIVTLDCTCHHLLTSCRCVFDAAAAATNSTALSHTECSRTIEQQYLIYSLLLVFWILTASLITCTRSLFVAGFRCLSVSFSNFLVCQFVFCWLNCGTRLLALESGTFWEFSVGLLVMWVHFIFLVSWYH